MSTKMLVMLIVVAGVATAIPCFIKNSMRQDREAVTGVSNQAQEQRERGPGLRIQQITEGFQVSESGNNIKGDVYQVIPRIAGTQGPNVIGFYYSKEDLEAGRTAASIFKLGKVKQVIVIVESE